MDASRAPVISLLLDSRAAVAELMAECPQCGAITAQIIELAWRARGITCPDCFVEMPVTDRVLDLLRNQAIEALATMNRLIRGYREPANE